MSLIPAESVASYFDKIAEINCDEALSHKDKFIGLSGVADALFKELTREEKQYFPDPFTRASFVFDKYEVLPELKAELNGLRIRAKKMVQQAGAEVAETEFLTGLKALAQAISHFGAQPVPDPILAVYQDREDLTFKKVRLTGHAQVPFVAVTILSIIPATESKPYTAISCDADELGEITVNLWDHAGGNDEKQRFATLGKKLWKFARLHLFHIQKLDGREDVYGTTAGTLIVLEPDFLIDATKLAECIQMQSSNARIYFLNKFKPAEITEALLFGHVANGVLDALVANPESSMADIFKNLMQEHAFSMVCLTDKGNICDVSGLRDMAQKAKVHGNTIKETISRYKGKKQQLEPSFFSANFGLQGRLDFLTEETDEPKRKNILELKSGSVPNLQYNALWSNNAAQVECYNMLLESVFPGRVGESSILYSRAPLQEEPLRNHSSTTSLRQTLMMVRNHILINEFRLAGGDPELYAEMDPAGFGTVAKFDLPVLQQFHDRLNQATPLEKAYFTEFASFVAREQRTAKTGSDAPDGITGFAGLWKATRTEKKEASNILDYLNFSSVTAQGEVTLTCSILSTTLSNFREGDIAVLYPVFREEDEQAALKTQILKCNLKAITDREIVVGLRSKHIEATHFQNNCLHWVIEHDLLENGFDHMYKGLYSFLNASREKREILLGLKKPTFEALPYTISGRKTDELTTLQRELLVKALSAKDYFLLQGPPGTGKTSGMMRSMAENLYHQTEESFAILAFTNRAVEEICEHLRKAELPFLLLSKRESEDPNTLSYLTRNNKVQEIHAAIKQTRIFVATQSSFAGFADLHKLKQLKNVIVDEASQLLEPQLAGILCRFERFILIGDDKQLPAVVAQPAKFTVSENELLHTINLRSLKDSLFYRLVTCCEQNGWEEATGMLTQQGRMHDEIAGYISNTYYHGKLRSIREDQRTRVSRFSKSSSERYEQALASSRMIFIPAERSAKAKVSASEAKHVAGLVKTIRKVYGTDFSSDTVGVVTPYRSQIANIATGGFLQDAQLKAVTIDTVERFQGSERDIIILSVAVNNPNQLHFLESFTADGLVDRKLNVALTRARTQLVITGCEEILYRSTGYARLIDHIKNTGGYIDWL
jgi:DNA replication ATP-dependent helicase Dna2